MSELRKQIREALANGYELVPYQHGTVKGHVIQPKEKTINDVLDAVIKALPDEYNQSAKSTLIDAKDNV